MLQKHADGRTCCPTGWSARSSPSPDLAAKLPGDRLGLIAFAGDAFLQCPLTLDHDAFLDALRDLDTDTIPRLGTDMATAINEASDALRSQPNNMKFVILISDGEDLEGRALEAARKAAQNGIKIYTVGVGTPEGDRIPERGEGAYLSYHHDLNGQEVISRLDENTLRQISDITGGSYAPLGAAGDGLEQIYNRSIALLPQQNQEEKRQKIHIERFEWPLAAAILLLMWEFLISERARAPKAEAPRRSTRRRSATKSMAATTAAVCVLMAAPIHAGRSQRCAASVSKGRLRHFDAGLWEVGAGLPQAGGTAVRLRRRGLQGGRILLGVRGISQGAGDAESQCPGAELL